MKPAFTLLVWLAAAAPVAAQVRSGGFVTRQDGKEITRERYRFDGTSLEAEVQFPGRGLRLSTKTEYTPALSPAHYRLAVFGMSGRLPVQDVTAAFADSVRWTARTAGTTSSGASRVIRPFGVMQDLTFSQLAVMLLRYSRPNGGVQVLDVWFPEGGRVGQLRMSFKGDTGTVDLGGSSMRVTTDRDGWLRSVAIPARRLAVDWSADITMSGPDGPAADTMPPGNIRESSFTFDGAGARLAGTIATPPAVNGRIPIAVIVAGSGGLDRNGNEPPGLRSNTYAQLAWRLAERGIASLRYDKRWAGASRDGPRPDSLTFDDFAGDVAAAVRAALTDHRFGPVVVVGHGEGGLLALRAATSGASFPVAGVALLATPGRIHREVVKEQLARQVDSATARRFADLFPRYAAGENVGTVPESLRPFLVPVNRRFVASFAGFDPARVVRAVRVPMLIVQGGADVQVTLRDAQLLRGGRPDAQLAIVPQATHLFKAATSGDRLAQLALLQDPTVPLVPELAATIGTWIDGLVRP